MNLLKTPLSLSFLTKDFFSPKKTIDQQVDEFFEEIFRAVNSRISRGSVLLQNKHYLTQRELKLREKEIEKIRKKLKSYAKK